MQSHSFFVSLFWTHAIILFPRFLVRSSVLIIKVRARISLKHLRICAVACRYIFLRWFAQMSVNNSSESATLNVATPVKLATALVFLLNLNRVEPTPAAQNPAAPVSRTGLVTNPSRGPQRACVRVRNAIIRRILQEHEIVMKRL